MLRIYGNRVLKTLPGLDTRPTSARVREALFNIWQGRLVGCRWLDPKPYAGERRRWWALSRLPVPTN